MRLWVATAFLVVGVVCVRESVLVVLGCLLLAWVPTLIVEHLAHTYLWAPRHPRMTLDELLDESLDHEEQNDAASRDDS